MLRTRVITALLMMAILLPALLYPSPEPFCALALAMLAVAAWEWGRLNGLAMVPALFLSAACAALCAVSWWQGLLTQALPRLWLVTGAAWVLLGCWGLARGVAGWGALAQPLRIVLGVAALWLAWLAVAQARVMGVNFLMSTLVLVWMADIAAYFAGKNFGMKFFKIKLAPGISPGKTWEGASGGALGVLLLAAVWLWLDQHFALGAASLYTRLSLAGLLTLVVACLFLSSMSVVGDLLESLVKRSAGAKDSSHLLPGHGGVLDRVDAVLPTLPLALMLVSWVSV